MNQNLVFLFVFVNYPLSWLGKPTLFWITRLGRYPKIKESNTNGMYVEEQKVCVCVLGNKLNTNLDNHAQSNHHVRAYQFIYYKTIFLIESC